MSSDVDTLEKKLNIKLSADIAQRCPQFLQILEKLSEKIDSRGLTQVTISGVGDFVFLL